MGSGRRTVERQPQFPISGTSLELVIMTKITVGLDEHNKVNGGITPMKPPGGESKLNLKEDDDGEEKEEEQEERCVRIMQPPGGSSNLFGESEDTAEEETKTPVKRPDRMKSSFELGGYEKGEEAVSPSPKKDESGMNPITGTVLGDDGKEVAVTMVQMVEKFEKSCKVPPGGHSTPLW